MADNYSVRLDKFLWAVRIYKTRSIASGECTKGKVIINNIKAKPSKIVQKDEIINVKKSYITFKYRIIEITGSRISAKLVDRYIEDITDNEEKAKLSFRKTGIFVQRDKGAGRPTKKERRTIDKLYDDFNEWTEN